MSNWDPAAGGASNPYDSPTGPSNFADSGAGKEITYQTIEIMRQTRPWAMVVGIASVILGCLSIALALFFVALIDEANQAEIVSGVVVYVVGGIVQLIVGVFSIRFSSKAGAFVASGSIPHLDDALQAQRSIWRLTGTIAAIMLGLLMLGLMAGVLGTMRSI